MLSAIQSSHRWYSSRFSDGADPSDLGEVVGPCLSAGGPLGAELFDGGHIVAVKVRVTFGRRERNLSHRASSVGVRLGGIISEGGLEYRP
jgi:hypothetical protein